MTQTEKIIQAVGGLRKLARLTGRSPATVHGWKIRGFVPSKHHMTIIHNSAGAVTANDFYGIEAPPKVSQKVSRREAVRARLAELNRQVSELEAALGAGEAQ